MEFVDKDTDYTNRIVIADPIFQAFRKQRALPPIRSLNEAPHSIPRKSRGESYPKNHSSTAFSHSQGQIRMSLDS
jgi:hypothetical protein